MNIGLIIIATGSLYRGYINSLLESARTHFFSDCGFNAYLWTDTEEAYPVEKQFYINGEAWPFPTLHRYHYMLDRETDLRGNDYLFYLDVDMLFADTVGREILADGITAILHPAYAISEGYKHPYEQNPLSTAYVSRQMYFCGGFQGGKADAFLRMASAIKSAIEADKDKGIIAAFHDESHLNRYLNDNKPALVLGPSYCYPEVALPGKSEAMRQHFVGHVWKQEHTPKILALEKPESAISARSE